MDWAALVTGAQRLVDWAAERVMAPHAEHKHPREHPQCIVCRTILLLGEPGAAGESTESEAAPEPQQIVWIPIVEAPDEP